MPQNAYEKSEEIVTPVDFIRPSKSSTRRRVL